MQEIVNQHLTQHFSSFDSVLKVHALFLGSQGLGNF